MKKIKEWLFARFLPAYCKERLTEDNKKLSGRVIELQQENRELRAYIEGLEQGIRALRKIKIVNNRGE